MTVFVPATGPKERDLLPDGGRKGPGVGLAGSRPLVSGGSVRLSGSEGQALVPPTSFQSPPVFDHYVWPLSPVLISTKDKWARKKSGTSPGGLVLCCWTDCV